MSIPPNPCSIKTLFSYTYSPDGQKFRSKTDIATYIAQHNLELNLDDFDFARLKNEAKCAAGIVPLQLARAPRGLKKEKEHKQKKRKKSVEVKKKEKISPKRDFPVTNQKLVVKMNFATPTKRREMEAKENRRRMRIERQQNKTGAKRGRPRKKPLEPTGPKIKFTRLVNDKADNDEEMSAAEISDKLLYEAEVFKQLAAAEKDDDRASSDTGGDEADDELGNNNSDVDLSNKENKMSDSLMAAVRRVSDSDGKNAGNGSEDEDVLQNLVTEESLLYPDFDQNVSDSDETDYSDDDEVDNDDDDETSDEEEEDVPFSNDLGTNSKENGQSDQSDTDDSKNSDHEPILEKLANEFSHPKGSRVTVEYIASFDYTPDISLNREIGNTDGNSFVLFEPLSQGDCVEEDSSQNSKSSGSINSRLCATSNGRVSDEHLDSVTPRKNGKRKRQTSGDIKSLDAFAVVRHAENVDSFQGTSKKRKLFGITAGNLVKNCHDHSSEVRCENKDSVCVTQSQKDELVSESSKSDSSVSVPKPTKTLIVSTKSDVTSVCKDKTDSFLESPHSDVDGELQTNKVEQTCPDSLDIENKLKIPDLMVKKDENENVKAHCCDNLEPFASDTNCTASGTDHISAKGTVRTSTGGTNHTSFGTDHSCLSRPSDSVDPGVDLDHRLSKPSDSSDPGVGLDHHLSKHSDSSSVGLDQNWSKSSDSVEPGVGLDNSLSKPSDSSGFRLDNSLSKASDSVEPGVCLDHSLRKPSDSSGPAVGLDHSLSKPSDSIVPGVGLDHSLSKPSDSSGVGLDQNLSNPSDSSCPDFGLDNSLSKPSDSSVPGFGLDNILSKPSDSSGPGFGLDNNLSKPSDSSGPGFGLENSLSRPSDSSGVGLDHSLSRPSDSSGPGFVKLRRRSSDAGSRHLIMKSRRVSWASAADSSAEERTSAEALAHDPFVLPKAVDGTRGNA